VQEIDPNVRYYKKYFLIEYLLKVILVLKIRSFMITFLSKIILDLIE